MSEQQVAFIERFEELEKLSEEEITGASTLEIREEIWAKIEPWDEELNKAYQVILEHHPNADTIKEEQRQWLDQFEKESGDIFASEAEFGTMMRIESDTYRLDETAKRAKELVNKYMN